MSIDDEAFLLALLEDDPAALYERAPCGYLTTSADGVILKANQTFATMCGYATDDLVNARRFSDLLAVGGRIYHETHYAPMLHMGGSAREIAFELVHRDSHTVPVLVNAVAERAVDGTVLAVRIAVFDATQRRRYEQELLHAKRRAEESEERARTLARNLQQTLIPPLPPDVPLLDVAAEYRPAGDGTEVGGDFYDVFQVGSSDWVITIGDVRGKGPEAAVVTAFARYTLRATAMSESTPATMLRRLNEALLGSGADRSCTICVIRLRRTDDGWHGVMSSAGHPLPVIRRADGALDCPGRYGTLLGAVADARLFDDELDLGAGESLILYTDGVTEARRDRDFYGEDRLRSVIMRAHETAQDLASDIRNDVLEFQGGDARDDIAIVVARAAQLPRHGR